MAKSIKPKIHQYLAHVVWTGNSGEGTSSYNSYQRDWRIETDGKEIIECSNDPVLGGDLTKHNPEDLLIASLASCHMLWYLHLCSRAGIVVTSYRDTPLAIGEMEPSGAGRFKSITLRPQITITSDSDENKARSIHNDIHNYCFIARSVNFPVDFNPVITRAG